MNQFLFPLDSAAVAENDAHTRRDKTPGVERQPKQRSAGGPVPPAFNSVDICIRCAEPRSEHAPAKDPELRAVTCLSGKSVVAGSCLAFIERGERFGLNDKLGPRSLAFFNFRWDQIHGSSSRLPKPWFASQEKKHAAA